MSYTSAHLLPSHLFYSLDSLNASNDNIGRYLYIHPIYSKSLI